MQTHPLNKLEDEAPGRAFRDWCDRSMAWHLAGMLVLAVVAFLRWKYGLIAGAPRVDEEHYLNAFQWLREGSSPYRETAYFYPPAFAYFGAWLGALLPPMAVVYLFRAANLVGLCWTLWLALAVVPLATPWRLAIGGGVLWLAQGVALGMSSGNISFAIIGLSLAAMVAWPRRPIASGALLGLGVAVKPLFPVGLIALGCHRPLREGRAHLWSAGCGLALGAALVLCVPYLGEMLEQATSDEKSSRAFSLQKMLANFGLELNPVAVAVLVALATVIWVRYRPLSTFQVLCVGISVSVLATPLLWSHTLMMTLPIQTLAFTLAFRRWRRAEARTTRRYRAYELATVASLIGSILACDGVDGVYNQPGFIQGLVIAFPTLAPAALTAYCLHFAEPF